MVCGCGADWKTASLRLEVLSPGDPRAASPPKKLVEEYQQPGCPKCGSLDISFETMNRGIALAALWAIFVTCANSKEVLEMHGLREQMAERHGC